MMIAPGEAGSDAGSNPTPNIGPLDSARLGLFAHGETDTARTHRTKHGPLGCKETSSAAGQPTAIAFTKHTRRKRPPASPLPPPAAERSVLCRVCPRCVRFPMSVETSHFMAVAAIKYADAVH